MSYKYFLRYCFVLFFLFLCVPAPCRAESASEDFRLDVKDFTLDNGMLFLVVERHTTPQIGCRVAIRAGSALEESGKTGIAHLLEHMMFKGTKNFGTLDPERDQELQRDIEAAYQTILAEETRRDPDRNLIGKKLDEMARLRKEVQEIYVPQAFSSHLERNGAFGVNAFTSKDQTQFTMSVPSDMIEQWFSSVSEQLFEPSWREFYVEKEVVQREWAFRYINNPAGAAWLDLSATAYRAHPYRNPTIGWRSDMAWVQYHRCGRISFQILQSGQRGLCPGRRPYRGSGKAPGGDLFRQISARQKGARESYGRTRAGGGQKEHKVSEGCSHP